MILRKDNRIDRLQNIGTDVQVIARAVQAAIVSSYQEAIRWVEKQFGFPWATIVSSPTIRIMAQYILLLGWNDSSAKS